MAARISLLLSPRFLCRPFLALGIRSCQTIATPPPADSNTKKRDISFDKLLNSSRFFEKDPVGRKVVAEIIAEREDDLYVDFGGKFHAVVQRPAKNGHLYRKGKWVDVIVEDLEVTEHFLGNNKDTSLLEAQVKMTGLSHYKPHPQQSNSNA